MKKFTMKTEESDICFKVFIYLALSRKVNIKTRRVDEVAVETEECVIDRGKKKITSTEMTEPPWSYIPFHQTRQINNSTWPWST